MALRWNGSSFPIWSVRLSPGESADGNKPALAGVEQKASNGPVHSAVGRGPGKPIVPRLVLGSRAQTQVCTSAAHAGAVHADECPCCATGKTLLSRHALSLGIRGVLLCWQVERALQRNSSG